MSAIPTGQVGPDGRPWYRDPNRSMPFQASNQAEADQIGARGDAPGAPGQPPGTPQDPTTAAAEAAYWNSLGWYNQQQLDQAKTAADRQWQQTQDQLQQIGIPTLDLAKQKQAFDEQMQTKMFGLQQGQLGLDYLKTAASLGGPSDWINAWNFNRGAQQQSQLPAWLNSLATNVAMTQNTAPSGTMAPPQSTATLAGGMTGQPTTPAPPSTAPGAASTDASMNAAQAQTAATYAAGGQAVAPGVIESLTPSELSGLAGGIKAIGGDSDAFLAKWKASRIGQTAGVGL